MLVIGFTMRGAGVDAAIRMVAPEIPDSWLAAARDGSDTLLTGGSISGRH
jgi:hypothetical protein